MKNHEQPEWSWVPPDASSDRSQPPVDESPWSWELPDPVPTAPRSRRRVPTWTLAALIPIAAIAPWFVPWPWQNDARPAAADPSALIQIATAPRADPKTGVRAPAAPTAATLVALRRQVAAHAVAGYDAPVSAKQLKGVATTPGAYQKVGRIVIKRMGLDVAFGEGVYAKSLDHGPGHWPGTALPGDPGTAVLSGHRNTHTAPFKYLNWLQPGDKIVVTVGKQKPVTFYVHDTTIVPEAKYPAFVLKPAADNTPRLTMFACHPEGNPIYRIVVRASVDPKGKA